MLVEEGEQVAEGQPLVLLEAMKMENEIRAAREGTVRSVRAVVGQRVVQNGIMLVIE